MGTFYGEDDPRDVGVKGLLDETHIRYAVEEVLHDKNECKTSVAFFLNKIPGYTFCSNTVPPRNIQTQRISSTLQVQFAQQHAQ